MTISIDHTVQMASAKLKRILRDNLYTRNVETTTGKLNFLALHKYKTSRKLFTRPQERAGKKYNVELLLDNSGSMYQQEYAAPAFEAAHYLCQLFGPLTDMNVTLFNYGEHTMNWKNFHKEFVDKEHKQNTYHWKYGDRKVGEDMYNIERVPDPSNTDGYEQTYKAAAGNWEISTILGARHRLLQKQGEKIIFILLDGHPNLDEHNVVNRGETSPKYFMNGVCLNNYPKEAYSARIQEIIDEGIKVVAFGLGFDVRKYYPVGTRIRTPENIVQHSVAIMEDLLK